ncbi:hypothetical protein ACO0QE_001724 [Hanseniaspora vineae]
MSSTTSKKALFREIVKNVLNGKAGRSNDLPEFRPDIASHPYLFPSKNVSTEQKERPEHIVTGEEVSMIYKSLNPYITIKNFISPLTANSQLRQLDIMYYLEKYGIVSISKLRHPHLFTFDHKYQLVFKNKEYSRSYFRNVKNSLYDGQLLTKLEYNLQNVNKELKEHISSSKLDPAFSSSERKTKEQNYTSNAMMQYLLNYPESQKIYKVYMNNLINAFEGETQYRANLQTKFDSNGFPLDTESSSELKDQVKPGVSLKEFHDIEKKSCILETSLPPKLLNYRNIPSILWQYDIKHVFPLKWTDLDSNGSQAGKPSVKNIYYIAFENTLDSGRFTRNFHGLHLYEHQLLIDLLCPM